MSKSQVKTQTKIKQQQETKKSEEKSEKPLMILRLQQPKSKPRVSWTEDTIDNEHMNKLKSNLCCIYHRPDQSSSDTCTSDDEGNALERDRNTKNLHKKKCSKLKKRKQKIEEVQKNKKQ